MPLRKGKKNIGRNIATELKAGKSRKQAIAIALNVAHQAKETGLPGQPTGTLLHGPNSMLGVLGAGQPKRKKKGKRIMFKELFDRMFPNLKESKGEKAGSEGHSGYLVTDKDGNKHLPTEKNGKPDRGLAGAAWAALHGGYRGNKYEGEGKSAALAKLKALYEREGWDLPGETKEAEFAITKDASGKYRWTMITSSSFEDRDGEVIAQSAHEKDIQQMQTTKEYGYLGWRHVGEPSDKNPSPQLPLIQLGMCDFSAMHDAVRIESGTFVDDVIPQKLEPHQKELSSSLTFYGDPDENGIYQNIRTVGRCVTFKQVAANPLATFGVQKENEGMEDQAIQQLEALIGKENVAKLIENAEAKTKAAREAGLRQKETHAHGHAHANLSHFHKKEDGKTMEHAHDLRHEHDHNHPADEMHDGNGTPEVHKEHKHAKEDLTLEHSHGKEMTAQLTTLQGKEIDPALMEVLAQMCAKLDLIQLELEQAEDREGVQEEPGYEEVEKAMAGVTKEIKTANDTYVQGLAKIKEVTDALAAIQKDVAMLKGDMPSGVSHRPSQADDNLLDAKLFESLIKKEASQHPLENLADWIIKPLNPQG